jgi:hypothetical protein
MLLRLSELIGTTSIMNVTFFCFFIFNIIAFVGQVNRKISITIAGVHPFDT